MDLLAYVDRVGVRRGSGHRQEVRRSPEPGDDLTVREREVLSQLVTGASNREISERLGSASKTVMHQTEAIYRKLGERGGRGGRVGVPERTRGLTSPAG